MLVYKFDNQIVVFVKAKHYFVGEVRLNILKPQKYF